MDNRERKERQFKRFLDMIKRLHINIPFIEAMEQIHRYAKFMKDLLTKKNRIQEKETIELEVGCSAIIQKFMPKKSSDQEVSCCQ